MVSIRSSNTLSAIRARLVAAIQEIDATMDTSQGTPVKDIVVDAPSAEIRNNYVVEDYVNRIKNVDAFLDILDDSNYLLDLKTAVGLETVEEVVAMVEADLDDFADTFGLTRRSSTKALYLQRFYRSDNNSGSAISIPLGTEVKTPDGLIAATVITSSPQVPVLDSTTGLYYVEETVEAVADGAAGNVALQTMTAMTPQLNQATSTSNVMLVSSGVDVEDNISLVDRIKEARKGRNYPTDSGIKRLAMGGLENSTLNFVDAKVIGPGHALMQRALAGAVDCYVVGKSTVTVIERILYVSGTTVYTLALQPVESVSSVVGEIAGSVSFVFNQDTTSGFTGSTRAVSAITITPGGLANGEAMTVTYLYDAAIRAAQDLTEEGGEFHVPTLDLLFRQSIQTLISIDLEVVQYGQRSTAEVQADVLADLAAFFDGGTTSQGVVYAPRAIGEHIDRSDIVALIAAIDDVDRITLTGTKAIVFYKDLVVSTESPIPVADNEHARLGTVTFL